MNTHADFIEIYRSYNDFESDVITDILDQNDIPYIVRDQRISQYPLTIDHFPERRIAVSREDAPRAREIIREAFASGSIPQDGVLIDDQ